ncbi:MAG: Efflux ABC transporter, permease protein, partial [uncultured Rubrobacteraceae bacterium]
ARRDQNSLAARGFPRLAAQPDHLQEVLEEHHVPELRGAAAVPRGIGPWARDVYPAGRHQRAGLRGVHRAGAAGEQRHVRRVLREHLRHLREAPIRQGLRRDHHHPRQRRGRGRRRVPVGRNQERSVRDGVLGRAGRARAGELAVGRARTAGVAPYRDHVQRHGDALYEPHPPDRLLLVLLHARHHAAVSGVRDLLPGGRLSGSGAAGGVVHAALPRGQRLPRARLRAVAGRPRGRCLDPGLHRRSGPRADPDNAQAPGQL